MLYSFLDPENVVEIVIIALLRSKLEVKLLQNPTSRIYVAAILKRVITHTCIFYFIVIGFRDPENIRIATKLVFLSGLQEKTSPKTDCCVAILFLPSKKIPQGCQAGISLIPTQEVSMMMNQS